MSTKKSRTGSKYGGTHTSIIPTAGVICDITNDCPHVKRISTGFIKAGLKPLRGQSRIKFKSDGKSLLLSIRGNTSHQEIRVYSNNIEITKTFIIEKAKENGFLISAQ